MDHEEITLPHQGVQLHLFFIVLPGIRYRQIYLYICESLVAAEYVDMGSEGSSLSRAEPERFLDMMFETFELYFFESLQSEAVFDD